MSSPFIPCPFQYNDLPQGGELAPIVIASRNPSNTIDLQYSSGYFWLSDRSKGGSGNLYFQSGSATGGVSWTLLTGVTLLSVAGTINQIVATNVSGDVTFSLSVTVVAPGSIRATTTLTASLGNILASNGNLVLNTPGNKLVIATGTNASVGLSAPMAGSPGAITILTTACTPASRILYSRATTGGTPGQVSISAQAAGSFTLRSTANETSTFNWLIIN